MQPLKESEFWLMGTEQELALLEAYAEPERELKIEFRVTWVHPIGLSMDAIVSEQATNEAVVHVSYSLTERSPVLDIGVIRAVKIAPSKVVQTVVASAEQATDLGYKAMRWVLREIARDARARGYPVRRWATSSRISGAWAKTNYDPERPLRGRRTGGKLDEWSLDQDHLSAHLFAEFLVEQLLGT